MEHQYHLWRKECLYGAQSGKKRRLFHESVFIPIDGWTLILKNGGKRSFSYKAEALIHLSRSGERICGTQSLKERKLLCESVFILIERWTLTLKMGQREAFLFKPKHQFIYLNG